jgi:hypothetical protein
MVTENPGRDADLSPRWPLIAPVRFSNEQPPIPVIIKISVTERKKDQNVPSGFLVKDEHLCLRISLGHPRRAKESILIRSVLTTE